MQRFGYEVLLTVLLPGFFVLVGILLIFDRAWSDVELYEQAKRLSEVEWQASFVVLGLSAYVGTFVATLMGFVEDWLLDRLAAARLDIRHGEFKQEWDRYVHSIDDHHNSYVSRLVFYFFFETRAGVASLFLGSVLLCGPELEGRRAVAWLVLVSGLVLFLAGCTAHGELAKFRHHRHATVMSVAGGTTT